MVLRIMFIISMIVLIFSACAGVAKKNCSHAKGEFMMIDEDRDLDFIRIEDYMAGDRSSSGCPT